MSLAKYNQGYNVGVGGAVVKGRSVLFVRRASRYGRGNWQIPGGFVDREETLDAAVVRELEEETGISDVRKVQVAAIFSHTYERTARRPYPPVHHVGIVYHVAPGLFDLRFEQDGSTDRCGWFTEAEARALPLVPVAQFAVGLTWPKA